MSHPRTRTLGGVHKRGNSYRLDYKDETGKRIRRSAGTDLHRALDPLYKLSVGRRCGHTKDGISASTASAADPGTHAAPEHAQPHGD